MNLILIGPQGCGKGTQAQRLADKYHLHHIEIGSLIRAQAHEHDKKSYIIDHLANKKGQLLPDGIILDLLTDQLDQIGYQNLLFDGFPRTTQQYESLKEILADKHQPLSAAFYLNITDQEAIRRLGSRRLCSACGKNYSLILEPDRKNCDCSGQLVQRQDDNPEAIQFRLNTYHHATRPVLDLLKQENLLIEIDGHQSIEDIYNQISAKIDKLQNEPTVSPQELYTSYPTQITKLTARQIVDSRGWPTIECTCHLSTGQAATAAVPSGASTGSHEAIELRDHNSADYLGKSVHTAVNNVNNILSLIASGHNPDELFMLDQLFINSDGTPNKSNLGANAILAASKAICRAGAVTADIPLYKHIAILSNNTTNLTIPTPIFNVINGGLHAGMNLDFQEFIILPNAEKIPSYPDQLATCISIFHHIHDLLKKQSQPVSVGDEGGFAPKLESNKQAIELLSQATQAVNLKFGSDVFVSLDLAANTYLKDNHYLLKDADQPLNFSEYLDFLASIIDQFNPFSFEDPVEEDNWDGWRQFTRRFGDKLTVIGDDLLVTNKDRLQQAIDQKACNAILVKNNQIGTITETIEVVKLAQKNGFKTITSHRSGETNDDFIADFSVGVGSDLVKFGAANRGERVAKYNRLLKINEELKL